MYVARRRSNSVVRWKCEGMGSLGGGEFEYMIGQGQGDWPQYRNSCRGRRGFRSLPVEKLSGDLQDKAYENSI